MSQNGHSYPKEGITRHLIWTAMATQPGSRFKKDMSASDGCRAQLGRNKTHGWLIRTAILEATGDTSFSRRGIPSFSRLARFTLFSGSETDRRLRWEAISFNGLALSSGSKSS